MKIIYFGSSDFAVPPLEALSTSRHKILAVVTAADKKKGRGQKIGLSAVKVFAQEKGLVLLQPENLADSGFLRSLRGKEADLFVVCSFGKILTKEFLQIPRLFAINIHASLLPKYRGAAPINWAIIKGEQETGISIFKMNEHLDQGEIILQKKERITSQDTAPSLSQRLSQASGQGILESLDLIEGKKANFFAQVESQATFAPKLKKEDGLIDWCSPVLDIQNRIRGLQPWPGTFTHFKNRLLKIWQSEVVQGEQEGAVPGEVVDAENQEGILVQTKKGRLLIKQLQLEGRKKVSALEFILGHKIKVGQKLGY